jgi:hypothetical protein
MNKNSDTITMNKMRSDFLTDFWKGCIVALGVSGYFPIYRVDTVNWIKLKRSY